MEAVADGGRDGIDRITGKPSQRRGSGAGDRDRTDDIQLGKLTFYH
jgi:hypothetical protein